MKKMDHNPLFAAGFGSIVETLGLVSCFSSTALLEITEQLLWSLQVKSVVLAVATNLTAGTLIVKFFLH
jgi:hypothetical protein